MSTTEKHPKFETIPLAKEYFRLSCGDRFFEVANYAEALTRSEAEQLRVTFKALSQLSQGKIFDKISSVELHTRDSLDDPAEAELDELNGDYNPDNQQVRISLDFVRGLTQSADPGFSAFREKRFPNVTITPLQFTLAHEAWHAMDSKRQRAVTLSAEEEKAREDFANSGAIIALGGDVSTIPVSIESMRQAVEQSDGTPTTDPSDIKLYKVA